MEFGSDGLMDSPWDILGPSSYRLKSEELGLSTIQVK